MNEIVCLKIFVALCLLGGNLVNGFCTDYSCIFGQRCCNDGYCCSQYEHDSQNIISTVTIGIGAIIGIVIGGIVFIVLCIIACVFCCCRPNRSNPGAVVHATATTTTTQQYGMQQYPTVQQYPPGAYPPAPTYQPQAYPQPVAYNNPSAVQPYPAKDPNQPDYSAQPPPY